MDMRGRVDAADADAGVGGRNERTDGGEGEERVGHVDAPICE